MNVINNSGNIFTNGGRIFSFDNNLSKAGTLGSVAISGLSPEQYGYNGGTVACDSQYAYITSYANGTIYRLPLGNLEATPDAFTGFTNAWGIDVDESEGWIFCACNGVIRKINRSTMTQTATISLTGVIAVSVDKVNKQIIVASAVSNIVYIYDYNLTFVMNISGISGTPTGVQADPSGGRYFVVFYNGNFRFYDYAGVLVQSYGTGSLPGDIALAPETGNIYLQTGNTIYSTSYSSPFTSGITAILMPGGSGKGITYDPVHDRILFSIRNNRLYYLPFLP